MRTADDRVRAALEGEGGKIERPMELVALDPHERDERFATALRLEEREIVQIGLDVLVDGVNLARLSENLPRSHAREMRHGAVGHEAAAEALDETVLVVLAGLDDDDPERSHENELLPGGL
jgi:hypothetical protein